MQTLKIIGLTALLWVLLIVGFVLGIIFVIIGTIIYVTIELIGDIVVLKFDDEELTKSWNDLITSICECMEAVTELFRFENEIEL